MSEPEPGSVLSMWTIFYSPRDCPGAYCVRRFDVVRGQPEPVPAPHALGPFVFLETARAAVPPYLHRLPRNPGDHPSVVETWL